MEMGPKAKIFAGSAFLTGTWQPAILVVLCREVDNCDKFEDCYQIIIVAFMATTGKSKGEVNLNILISLPYNNLFSYQTRFWVTSYQEE